MSDLTPKQQRFVTEYLIDLNATQAAIRAGYSEKTAYSIGHENLSKPEIQAALASAQKEAFESAKVTPERVLKEYSRLAFLDIRKALTDDGTLKPIHELDDDTAAAIAGLEVEELWEGKGEGREHIGRVKKIKLSDKKGALDSLAKHLGMFVERHEHTGKDGGPIVTEDRTPLETARRIAFLLSQATQKPKSAS